MVDAPSNAQYLFIAGQGGEENTEGKLTPDIRTQIRHSLYNFKIALETQGVGMGDICQICSVVDLDKLNNIAI